MKHKIVLLLLMSLFAQTAIGQVGVYKSSGYGAIKKERKHRQYEWNRIVLFNYEHNFGLMDQNSLGFTYAKCKIGGFYGSFTVGTEWPTADVKGDARGYFLTDEFAHRSFSVSAGGMIRIVVPVYVYMGLGAYLNDYYTKTIEGQWVEVERRGYPKFEIGLMASIKKYTIQFGVGGPWTYVKLGLGYSFEVKNNRNSEQKGGVEQ